MKEEYYGQPNMNGCSVVIITIVIFVGFGIIWLLSPVFAVIAKYKVEINFFIMIFLLGILFLLNRIDRKTPKNKTTDNTKATSVKENELKDSYNKPKASNSPSHIVQQTNIAKASDNLNHLSKVTNQLTRKQDNEDNDIKHLTTQIRDRELDNVVVDEYGAKYDKDYTRLIQGPSSTIRSYKVKYGTKVICEKAFSDLFEINNLEEVYLPETIVKIGFAAFHNCKKLKQVHLPSSLIEIGKDAFRNCISIELVILPKQLASIGAGAFSGCFCMFESKSLKFYCKVNLLLSSDLKILYHCRANAEYVIVPNTVETIGECAFSDCARLIGVEIPSSVLYIKDYAFEKCMSLSKVLFHDNLQVIGFGAFAGCESLTHIVFPNSILRIDDLAFSGCSNLCTVFFPKRIVRLGRNSFDCRQSLPCLFVPHSHYHEYKNHFSSYKNVVFVDNSVFSLSAFESFFGVGRIVGEKPPYALLFEVSIMVLFDKESSDYLQNHTNGNGDYTVDYGLIRIQADREYITGFKAYFTQYIDDVLL